MSEAAFTVEMPRQRRTGVVFASPHSGSSYSERFLAQSILGAGQIRSSEDAFVDQLFACAPHYGAPLLCAKAPRAYLDLNRAPDELDPALIVGVPRRGQNPRIASGLGVIPRVVAHGRAIYRGKLPLEEAQARINRFWHPYHEQLRRMMEQAAQDFGVAILIDCHSMPHEAVTDFRQGAGPRPDVVLGDRFGASASADIVDRIEAAFVAAGLKVARNTPFAGAYIAQTYGRPSRNHHAVQVEIDRALYMDEADVRPNANFHAFQALLGGVVADLVELGRECRDMAAE